MKTLIVRHATLLIILMSFLLPVTVPAAALYEGKTINIISGHAPGGGYDRLARLLAKHLTKHIPGKPTIIVQNMPGAASVIAANYIFNVAKPNGLTIASLDRGVISGQFLREQGVKFDLNKFAWIGSAASEPRTFLIRNDLPQNTLEELLKMKAIHIGDTGNGNYTRIIPFIFKHYAGLKANMITYATGSRDIMLALERKEVDACYLTYSSNKPFIQRGLVRPLFRGRVSVPEIDKLPVDEDLVTDKKAKTLMAILSAIDLVGRPYITSPKTPESHMKILREAFRKLDQDKELQVDAKKLMMDVNYMAPEECLKVINFVFRQPEEMVKEFETYYKM